MMLKIELSNRLSIFGTYNSPKYLRMFRVNVPYVEIFEEGKDVFDYPYTGSLYITPIFENLKLQLGEGKFSKGLFKQPTEDDFRKIGYLFTDLLNKISVGRSGYTAEKEFLDEFNKIFGRKLRYFTNHFKYTQYNLYLVFDLEVR